MPQNSHETKILYVAGVAGRSGRKPPPAVGITLPPLGETELEVARYVAAVAVGVAAGQIDCRMADTLVSAARVAAGVIKRNAESREIETLREWRAELLGLKQQSSMVAAGVRAVKTPS